MAHCARYITDTLKESFCRKYKVEVTKEKEMEITIPFAYLARDEMAAPPYNMSETLLLQISAPETQTTPLTMKSCR